MMPGCALIRWAPETRVDPDRVRGAVEEVFADPAYSEITRPVVVPQKFFETLRGVVEHALEGLKEVLSWISGLQSTAPFLYWGIIAALLCVLFLLLLHIVATLRFAFVSVRRGSKKPEDEEAPPGKVLHKELLLRAQDLARRGEFAEGIRTLLLALFALFGEKKPGAVPDGWTNHEVVAKLTIDDVNRGQLGELARTVDRVWYGRGEATGPEFDRAAGIVESVSRG